MTNSTASIIVKRLCAQLKEAERVIASYERLCRDRGNIPQAEALRRKNRELCETRKAATVALQHATDPPEHDWTDGAGALPRVYPQHDPRCEPDRGICVFGCPLH